MVTYSIEKGIPHQLCVTQQIHMFSLSRSWTDLQNIHVYKHVCMHTHARACACAPTHTHQKEKTKNKQKPKPWFTSFLTHGHIALTFLLLMHKSTNSQCCGVCDRIKSVWLCRQNNFVFTKENCIFHTPYIRWPWKITLFLSGLSNQDKNKLL